MASGEFEATTSMIEHDLGAGCGVRGAGCGVRGAGCGVRGAGCGAQRRGSRGCQGVSRFLAVLASSVQASSTCASVVCGEPTASRSV
ncbi:hypothetical protein C7C45_13505 [Micromonospora arborensis]|uniref:Uncharacterized protein n=1 Tax=Micromonospora arborensis TaxID=2116518 RepID=A0A318NUP5_9ACTN|nr:hypothetical protein C7C45_13505 [Micromonospora arborensis]